MAPVFFFLDCAFNKLGGVEVVVFEVVGVGGVVVEVLAVVVSVIVVSFAGTVGLVVFIVVVGAVVVAVDVVAVEAFDVAVSSIVSSFSLILPILSTLFIPAIVALDKVPFVLLAATVCMFLPNDFPKKAPRSPIGGICLFCLLGVLTVQ